MSILLLACASAPACDQGSATAPTTRPASTVVREWHITEALDPNEVDAERIVDAIVTTPVAYVENPGHVRLVLPDGESHDAEPFLVQAWQEGGRLVGVRLLFPAESLDAAVGRAQEILNEWTVVSAGQAEKLERWHSERKRLGYRFNTQGDPLHVSFNSDQERRFPRQVEIRPSTDLSRPWYVAVGVSFRSERERQRQAATGPVSAPTSQSK